MSVIKEAPYSTRWNSRFIFDLALALEGSGEPIKDILAQHNLSKQDLDGFLNDNVFKSQLGDFRQQIRDKGLTFRLKARTQAEELLMTSWNLIHDGMVSPAVKADLIKSTVKWAGLEPSGKADGEGSGSGVSIIINMGDTPAPEPKMRVIEG